MTRRMLLAAATGLAVLSGGVTAQASFIVTGGTAGQIPGASPANEGLAPLGFVNPLGGWYGGQLSTTTAGQVRFELMGWEASATNTFRWTGASPFSFNNTVPAADNSWNAAGFASQTRSMAAGLLPFTFSSDFDPPGSGTPGSVANGANPFENPNNPNASALNFFISLGMPPGTGTSGGATTGSVAYLWFDDRGGTRRVGNNNVGDDDNHDDLVIRLTFSPSPAPAPVPEPATLALFGAGLLGLGMARRRRPA